MISFDLPHRGPLGQAGGARTGSRTVPVALLLPALLGLLLLVAPLAGLLAETPWRTLPRRLAEPAVLSALRLSLTTATLATVICLLLGVPLGWLIARVDFPGVRLVRALVTVPLVLPPVVGGVALLLVAGRRSPLGGWLDATFGVRLPFSTAGVVLAEAFVALPFLVLAVVGALRGADTRYEEAAATLGAGRFATFATVTLPIISPGIGAGTVLCWARALGEFGATITFAGNFPGRTQTMPLAVYLAMETDLPAAIVLSVILLLISLVILFAVPSRWGAG